MRKELQIEYRPKTFDEFLGSKSAINGILSKFTAPTGFHHSTLLVGPKGSGKTTLARLISKKLGCMDAELYEINNANMRGIDTSREIIENSTHPPMIGPCKVFFIDECFPRNTRIELKNGDKVPIRKIVSRFRKGEKITVKSINLKNGEIEAKEVVGVFSKKYKGEFFHFVVQGGDEFKCTPDHKILTDTGFVEARFLTIGSKVKQKSILDSFRIQAIRGMLLGDASANILKFNARLQLVQGFKQKRYLEDKYSLLSSITNQSIKENRNCGYNGKSHIFLFSTLCCGQMHDIVKGLYIGGKKIVTEKFLSKLDDISLAYWYMDDGSLSNNDVTLHTQGYSKEENDTMCVWFKSYLFGKDHDKEFSRTVADNSSKWKKSRKRKYTSTPNKEIHVMPVGKYYCIRFNRLASDIFLKRISRYIYPSMQYKSYYPALLKNPDLKEGIWDAEIVKIWQSKPYTEYVYDITVEDNHNFLISHRGIVVSNCHKLTNDAQNALLKILEEPPKYTYFILATTEPEKLLDTVKDRCTTYRVTPLSDDLMYKLIDWVLSKEKVEISKDIKERLVFVSEGTPRTALRLLDQILDVDEEQKRKIIEEAMVDKAAVLDLCRWLNKAEKAPQEKWNILRGIVKGLEGQDPEHIRRAVLTYFSKVLLDSEGSRAKRVEEIISIFDGSYFTSGRAGLILGVYRASLK